MPKDLSAAATPARNALVSKLAGDTKKKYEIKSGKTLRDEPGSFNLLAYGEAGTGKTKIIVDLLLLGMKVQVINTDFGRIGIETVRNYFQDHPEHMKFFDENFRSVDLDVEGVMAFCRNPQVVIDDIYTWDPDVIFWDGMSAYQQGDLEASLCDDDFKRDDADFSTWRGSRNGTIFPLMRLLNQHNTENGKPWSKVVTMLEDERIERRKGATKAEKKDGSDIIAGSETKGPMLNTTARDLASAGFSIVLRCLKKVVGRDVVFSYQTRGSQLIAKDRYGLPESLPGDFQAVYKTYIEPKIKGALHEGKSK